MSNGTTGQVRTEATLPNIRDSQFNAKDKLHALNSVASKIKGHLIGEESAKGEEASDAPLPPGLLAELQDIGEQQHSHLQRLGETIEAIGRLVGAEI